MAKTVGNKLRTKRGAKRTGRVNGKALRSRGAEVLAQGVGNVPARAFGAGAYSSNPDLCWDAKMPQHLPLPRAVGPYTTIRATKRLNTNSKAMEFGTFYRPATDNWTTSVLMSSVNSAAPVNDPANTTRHAVDLSALGDSVTLVPSAFTVQMMNPEALQTTSGIVYAGISRTQVRLGGRTDTWDDVFGQLIEFQGPRLLAAGKLALRGVQASSYPMDMSRCANFTQLSRYNEGAIEYTDAVDQPAGWAPYYVYNPNQIDLEFLVTVEYRVRFDFSHPASSSHVKHPVTADRVWDAAVTKAEAKGHNVLDIAERVATVGATLAGVAQAGSRLATML